MESVTTRSAASYIAGRGFRPTPARPVGLEAEFFVVDQADPRRVPPPGEIRAVLGDLAVPARSRLTFEPGGQLELSTAPGADVFAAIGALRGDLDAVQSCLGARGFAVRGGGVEADRLPHWWGSGFRYDAMAAHFARCGGAAAVAGTVMMTATAGLQLNLDAGADRAAIARRWELAHLLGPVLSAAFACSPVLAGRPTGAASARLVAWQQLERCRAAPVAGSADARSPGGQWAAYALAATVMVITDGDGSGRAPQSGFTMREWLQNAALGGRPVELGDLDYHLTTLFPPVRPRGFLELRYLDEQRLEHWPVAAAVTAVLHDDPIAAVLAAEACRPAADRWGEAARCALADEPLRVAAQECFEIARTALARAAAPAGLQQSVAEFAARYTERGRCPADDTDPASSSGQPLPVEPARPELLSGQVR